MSENGETEINPFGTSVLCEKYSEVFEGIAHFVKIYITIKAKGFHKGFTVMWCPVILMQPEQNCPSMKTVRNTK